jgi:hypothetical protein
MTSIEGPSPMTSIEGPSPMTSIEGPSPMTTGFQLATSTALPFGCGPGHVAPAPRIVALSKSLPSVHASLRISLTAVPNSSLSGGSERLSASDCGDAC